MGGGVQKNKGTFIEMRYNYYKFIYTSRGDMTFLINRIKFLQ